MKRKLEAKLVDWMHSEDRRPLLLYGARQVGKTYLLNAFGEKFYKNVVYINLETNLSVAAYFSEDLSTERLIRFLETVANTSIIPGETLIIFDEVQSCERAFISLKYFHENAPKYHVAAAGSLLGVAVNRENYSFPVGQVTSMTLYPMDFEEFLWAVGEERLANLIRETYNEKGNMPEALHRRALDLYRYYLIVGGMPASINEYVKEKRLILVPNLQSEILSNYTADMAKYTAPSETVKIRACFNSIPAQLAKENKKFQYKVIQKGGGAAIFGASIDWLEQSGVIMKCQKTEQGINPISVYSDLSSFKIYMSDVGLLTMKSGIAQQSVLMNDMNPFLGALYENYIAQALCTNGFELYYWTSGNQAELDFLIEKDGMIVPIEVKKGQKVKSRSLSVFNERYKPNYSIRFSEKNFGWSDVLWSLPLYAAFCFVKATK